MFAGSDSFTYTVSDGHGGSATGTVTIDVVAVAPGSVLTITDSCLGGTALLITGTTGHDTIVVLRDADGTTLTVVLNGVVTTVAAPSGRIIVVGGAGNDNLLLPAVTNPVWLYGEAGNDLLMAGDGGGLLIGGDGDDLLIGGRGRDVMIGGEGADKLIASGNDDILVADLTTFDGRSVAGHEKFWCDVLAEWNSSNSFAVRVQNLRDGTGGNAHNGGSLLSPNVVDDLLADSFDLLLGGSGNDWLIFESGEDHVVGGSEASN
jgi:Ca2+-binding RTX toxin-like protein